jgi:adenylate cyclase
VRRRLAAIAFADVVGYSVLMAQDEARTHQQWMTVLADVIRPLAAQRGGTIVKLLGDGVLAEFTSALAAVEWAREVQAALAGKPQEASRPTLPLIMRIAVHLGDVIDAENDIYGDGVNAAARLQEHAPPGGLVLSEVVYESVRGGADIDARDLGLLDLKGVRPLRAYAVEPDAAASIIPFRPEPGKLPSIAVLPLENLGGTPSDDYFCDGVVEDITLSLAGLRELMVISRGSTLAYRGRQADPREVGRALGVRYVMTGTVRRSSQAVRVSVELCDASSGASLWAERVEFSPGELFDVQDRIVARIVSGIAPNVRAAELRAAMRKRPENFTAYDYTLRALHVIHSLDVNTFRMAHDYLVQAMNLDPNFAMPVAWAARWHSLYVGQGWSEDSAADSAKAAELAAKAIELDPQNALALATYGHLRSFLFHDYDTALSYFDRALMAGPNNSLAWLLSSGTLSYVGRSDEAIAHAEHALRLSPLDQSLFYYYNFLNLSHYEKGNYEQAVRWGRLSDNENPAYTANLRVLVAALAAASKHDEARAVARRLIELEPDFRLGAYARTRQPFRMTETAAKYLEHLRSSGLPD